MPAQETPKVKAKIMDMRPTVRVDDEKGVIEMWLITYEMEPGYRNTLQIDKDQFSVEEFAKRVKAQEKIRLDTIGTEIEI